MQQQDAAAGCSSRMQQQDAVGCSRMQQQDAAAGCSSSDKVKDKNDKWP